MLLTLDNAQVHPTAKNYLAPNVSSEKPCPHAVSGAEQVANVLVCSNPTSSWKQCPQGRVLSPRLAKALELAGS